MLSPGRGHAVFLRDAVVSTLLLAVPMGLYRAYVDPSVLQIPGMALYIPFMVVYIVLGGETEAGRGPSALHIALYLVVLGLLVATVAHYVRGRNTKTEN